MSDTPGVSPFQYQGYGNGVMRDSINLQSGSLEFNLNLTKLTSRNNWTSLVSAGYSSALALRAAKLSNETMPTGVMGLGWTLSLAAITAESTNFDLPEQRQYYLSKGGSPQKLHLIQRQWQRGAIGADVTPAAGTISDALRAALQENGLAVSPGAQVTANGGGFAIADDEAQQFLRLEANAGGGYDVFDGGFSFESEAFDFSRISYYPQYETWRVQNRDGTTDIYGSDDNARVFCVAFDDDVLPTNEQTGEQKVVGWSLRESRNKWGDYTRFTYDSVMQAVGGSEYTKAVYLARMENNIGFYALFHYEEKAWSLRQKEYFDPNKAQPNNTPDAFQSQYQTRYLDSVATYSNRLGADGQNLLIDTIQLHYDLRDYSDGTEKVQGESTKRLLTSAQIITESGLGEAPLLLHYGDAGSKAPGAITAITYPHGGRMLYTYSLKDLGAWSQRSLEIQNPMGAGYPKIWFGPDYAVIAWINGSEVHVQIYTWVGRWQLFDFPQLDSLKGVDPATLACTTQGDFCVLNYVNATHTQATSIALHKDARITGAWNEATITTPDTDQISVVSGKNFFAINDMKNNKLDGYAWDALGQAWNETALDASTLPNNRSAIFTAANSSTLLSFDYDAANAAGSKKSTYKLFAVNPLTNELELQTQQADSQTRIFQDDDKTKLRQHFVLAGSDWGYVSEAMTGLTPSSSVDYQQQIRRITESSGKYDLAAPYASNYRNTINAETKFPAFFAPQISGTGMVVSAGNMTRWDGKTYKQNSDLAPELPYGADDGYLTAAAADYAVRTAYVGGLQKTDVTAFNPDTGTFVTTPVYNGAPQGTNAGFPTASADFLSIGNEIYNRGTSLDWRTPLSQRPTASLAADGNPASVMNAAPGLFTYVDGAYVSQGDDKPPVFQPGNTHFVSLRNNNVHEDELIPGQQYAFGESTDSVPGNGLSYYTYSSAESAKTGVHAITLYRTIGDSVKDVVPNYQVDKVDMDDGFDQTGYSIDYDDKTAVVDPSGTFVKYYQVDVYPNLTHSMEHGFTRYNYINSLAHIRQDQNPTVPAVYDGQLKRGSIFNSRREEVQYTDADYTFAYAIASTPTGGADTPIYGSYLESGIVTKLKDGVISQVQFACSPANGLTKFTAWQNHKIIGGTQDFAKTDTFGFEVYDALWYRNDLTTNVQTKTMVNDAGRDACAESRADTLVPWAAADGSAVLAVGSSFVWEGKEGSSDYDFASDQNTGWTELSRVTLRSVFGPVTESEKPISLPHAVIYDKYDNLPVAVFSYTRLANVNYCGFEDYEKTPGANTDGAYTGLGMASIAGGASLDIPVTLPAEGDYMLAYCAKADGGDWEYHFERISQGAGSVSISNAAPGALLVDHVYVSPFDAPPDVTIYEGAAYRVGWEIHDFGMVQRNIYDNYQRKNGAVMTARCKEVRPSNLNANYFARIYGYDVNPAEPNLMSTSAPQDDAKYFRTYTPGCFDGYQNDYGVYINLPTTAVPLSFTIGGQSLTWQPGSGWLFGGGAQRRLTRGVTQFPSTLMILARKKLYVVADGKMVVATDISADGDYTLSCDAATGGALRDIVIGRNWLLSIASYDGGAKLRQNTGVGDERWIVSETLYNTLAKTHIRTKEAYISPTGIVAGYDPTFAQRQLTPSVSDTLKGWLASAYPADDGYPFTSTRYEDTPVGRVVELGLPGEPYAILDAKKPEQNHTEKTYYSDLLSLIPQMSLPAQHFAAATHFDADNRPSVDITDQMEQRAAHIIQGRDDGAGLADYDIARFWRDYYDDHQDNVAQTPKGYDTTDQFIRCESTNPLGLSFASAEPNSGVVQHIYSCPRWLPRLSQTEQQRADGITSYVKYDAFDRVVQEGTVPVSGGILTDEMQQKANGKFPTRSDKPDVYMVRKYGEDETQPQNAARLVAVYIYEGDCRMSEEHFDYSPFGEVEVYSVTYCDSTYQTKYVYNCQIKTIRMDYPSDQPYAVLYHYNDLGRVGAMSEIAEGQQRQLGTYDYTPHGAIALEELDLPDLGVSQTTYSYNSPEWLTKIEGPDMTEEIAYLEGGVDGKGYYAPKLCRMKVTITNPQAQGPKEELYLVEYDQAGRVSRAECSLDGTPYPDWSYDENIAYDENGNILSIKGENATFKAGTDQLEEKTDANSSINF